MSYSVMHVISMYILGPHNFVFVCSKLRSFMSCLVSLLQLQSPMQIMLAIDADQKLELESMIQELEDENR